MTKDGLLSTTALHSEHGASIFERYFHCPGSVRLCRTVPNSTSEYAAEGTAAHELASTCMVNGKDADHYIDHTILGFVVTEEMAEAVQVYLDHCRALIEAHPGCKYWVEQKFNLDPLYNKVPLFGTGDFVLFDPTSKLVIVVDYKHGRGYAVEVIKANGRLNGQLLYYALGSIFSLPRECPVGKIKITIVQPRAYHPAGGIRSAETTALGLVEWSADLVDAVEATLPQDALLVAGAHCRDCFCPAIAVCPAVASKSLAVAQAQFKDLDEPTITLPSPELLTPEQLLKVLDGADLFEGWLKEVRAHCHHLLEQGATIPGWRLAAKQARRKWDSEDDELITVGLTDRFPALEGQDLYNHKLKTPAQMEKLLPKANREDMAEFVTKASSGTNLVRDGDPRPGAMARISTQFKPLEDYDPGL